MKPARKVLLSKIKMEEESSSVSDGEVLVVTYGQTSMTVSSRRFGIWKWVHKEPAHDIDGNPEK